MSSLIDAHRDGSTSVSQTNYFSGCRSMTMETFGKAMPIHLFMLQLVGYEPTERDMRPANGLNARKRAMMNGLHQLKRRTDADFGYDAARWREFLIESGDEFGYTHPYAFSAVDKAVRKALSDPNIVATLDLLSNGGG